ncbi:MAG: hypothetical protein ACKVVP_02385 [Chloroflexota bacterium]
MISIYLRGGDFAEVDAEKVECRLWDFADGTQASSLVCLDSEDVVVGQFLVDQIAGWVYSEDEVYDLDDDDDE